MALPRLWALIAGNTPVRLVPDPEPDPEPDPGF